MLMLIAGLLVACGGDDDAPGPDDMGGDEVDCVIEVEGTGEPVCDEWRCCGPRGHECDIECQDCHPPLTCFSCADSDGRVCSYRGEVYACQTYVECSGR